MQDILGNSLTADTNEEIEAVSGKIILTPKNKDALQLNNIVLDLIQGENTFYTSVDSIAYDNIEKEVNYPHGIPKFSNAFWNASTCTQIEERCNHNAST